MTKSALANKRKSAKSDGRFLTTATSLVYALCVIYLSVSFSDKIAHSVRSGLSLCADVIIPSVFPFIILSDFLYSNLDFSKINFINTSFERIFKISRSGIYAFLLGIMCGFPLGVKCARDLYVNGSITRGEAERLIGFSNNTGPAFLIAGIGLGLRKNTAEGLLLYFIMILSAIAVGSLFSVGQHAERSDNSLPRPKFTLTISIKNAGINTINICAYLTFFACICGLLRNILGESIPYVSLLPFLEIGSSASILSKTAILSREESFALTAFAVGFSGCSVHLQALSFLIDTDIRTHKYFIMKLLQGSIAFLISYPLHKLIIG